MDINTSEGKIRASELYDKYGSWKNMRTMTEVTENRTEQPVKLYLEAHVTIEPVFDKRREQAAEIAKLYDFKLAHLLMKKDREATEQRSDRDTFMTSHSKFKSDIVMRTQELVRTLKIEGFKVWRYKVEDTLLDSKLKDIYDLL